MRDFWHKRRACNLACNHGFYRSPHSHLMYIITIQGFRTTQSTQVFFLNFHLLLHPNFHKFTLKGRTLQKLATCGKWVYSSARAYHSKIRQIEWFKQQKFIFQVLEVSSRIQLPSHTVLTWPFFWLCSSCLRYGYGPILCI